MKKQTELSIRMKECLVYLTGERKDIQRPICTTYGYLMSRGLVDDEYNLTKEGARIAHELIALMPPPPPPKTEEEIRTNKLIEDVQTFQDIFYPRRTWADPTVYSRSETFDLLASLELLRRDGYITIRTKLIPRCDFDRSRWIHRLSYGHLDHQAYGRCSSSRGQNDLREQRWSAYRALRRQNKGKSIEFDSQLPFCHYCPESQQAIIAGNVDTGRALQFVSWNSIKSLGVISFPDRAETEEEYMAVYRKWKVTYLDFSETALRFINQHFEDKNKEFADYLQKASQYQAEHFNDFAAMLRKSA